MTVKEFKKLPKEEFLKYEGMTEEIYDALQKSQEGWISIKHKTRGDIHHGYTSAFGKGISVRIDNPSGWYVTSVIQDIDWENSEFTTLNSVYEFDFKSIND